MSHDVYGAGLRGAAAMGQQSVRSVGESVGQQKPGIDRKQYTRLIVRFSNGQTLEAFYDAEGKTFDEQKADVVKGLENLRQKLEEPWPTEPAPAYQAIETDLSLPQAS